jgi:hypothetical protein
MSRRRIPTGQLMKLGVAQAVLFVVGALLGRYLGLLLGLDAFGAAGYGNREIFGILLIGLGGGGGGAAGARLVRAQVRQPARLKNRSRKDPTNQRECRRWRLSNLSR